MIHKKYFKNISNDTIDANNHSKNLTRLYSFALFCPGDLYILRLFHENNFKLLKYMQIEVFIFPFASYKNVNQ